MQQNPPKIPKSQHCFGKNCSLTTEKEETQWWWGQLRTRQASRTGLTLSTAVLASALPELPGSLLWQMAPWQCSYCWMTACHSCCLRLQPRAQKSPKHLKNFSCRTAGWELSWWRRPGWTWALLQLGPAQSTGQQQEQQGTEKTQMLLSCEMIADY